ncbi:hypothetical protein [Ralstonia solanacearum]|uniref:hypothetical protein n=1 Tax=Ralstonia solanacearum TaxID=305 RepID=UPI001F098CA3|nr:hypothetical protein [Ralstonia solanacearum]
MQLPPAHYAEAPLDTYRQLIAQVAQLQAFVKTVRAFADQVSELRYADLARSAILAAGRDHGTVRIDDHGQTVKCDLTRIVEWDQIKLKQLSRNIAAAGDDPEQYMVVTFYAYRGDMSAGPRGPPPSGRREPSFLKHNTGGTSATSV